jgi:hypothetical protein
MNVLNIRERRSFGPLLVASDYWQSPIAADACTTGNILSLRAQNDLPVIIRAAAASSREILTFYKNDFPGELRCRRLHALSRLIAYESRSEQRYGKHGSSLPEA